jgi:hypothetical protein
LGFLKIRVRIPPGDGEVAWFICDALNVNTPFTPYVQDNFLLSLSCEVGLSDQNEAKNHSM